jgi:predicted Rossmann fold nucleotide-binding protein DprA/Smf involved in DNA uptake
MVRSEENAYWISLAHIPKWGSAKINNLIIKIYHENKITIDEFFHLSEDEWKNIYGLSDNDITDLLKAKPGLPNNAFLAEDLLNQGFSLIPIISPDYSSILKSNLKSTYSPPLLYVKGDKQMFQEKSVAIVGSRNAAEISLKFTDCIAQMVTNEFKVVVSGFAKGVDKQALDSALKYNGRSIIVLPQGIMTFGSGFKTYYKQIVEGNVLVLSTFYPKAPWRPELAMARNPIIYGLANEIYVAESSEKGGTWSGVIDGLRKKRTIYVRKPLPTEQNANNILIQKGAIPVEFTDNKIGIVHIEKALEQREGSKAVVIPGEEPIEEKIREILKDSRLPAEEILEKLNNDWSIKKLFKVLHSLNFIEITKKKGKSYFNIRADSDTEQLELTL